MGQHLGPAKVGIRSHMAVRIPAGDGLLQHRRGSSRICARAVSVSALIQPFASSALLSSLQS